ncbi:hypothetical protein ACFWWT_29440 [Streptomyces sp. NPDC058676]|uniref:hypothetical protein n=1 Tax=Streptomyces sp. NPDC058676 TaxID=3346593 RepID=UPI003647A200
MKNTYLFQGGFEPEATSPPADAAAELAERIEASMRPGEIGSVYAGASSGGEVVIGNDTHEEADLFRLGASTLFDYISVDLVTHTDVWLPYDLKGWPQPEVCASNGPRLSAALRDLSEALDSETDPDDPTYFAKPNETGAANFFDENANALDVWGSFEVPYRHGMFTQTPGFGRIGYRRTVEGDVRYVPVKDDRGDVLGYLWVSDSEPAASFEPQDVGDDTVYQAGLIWLQRLRSAYDRGLSPAAALVELSAMPDEKGAGHVDPTSEPRTAALTALRDREAG